MTIEINQRVMTPNGEGVVQFSWYNITDPDGEYVAVRHPKGIEIDKTLAAWTPEKGSSKTGWLAAYKLSEIA